MAAMQDDQSGPETGSAVHRRLGDLGIVPVVVLEQAAQAEPLAMALVAGGLPVAEVTFRTEAAAEAIAVMSRQADMLVGAGTVLSVEQVDEAVSAGAAFIVSPGWSDAVVAYCQSRGIPVFPGVATASEVQRAWEAGLRTVKFFPAESSGGLAAVRSLAAPYRMMSFIPTGGITAELAVDYLAHPAVHAVGGSWMVPSALVRAGQFEQISTLAAEAVASVAPARAK